MPTFKQTVEIKDRPWNRAVKVTITAPSLDGVDVQALAQKAWGAPTKKIVEGPITVKVEGVRVLGAPTPHFLLNKGPLGGPQ